MVCIVGLVFYDLYALNDSLEDVLTIGYHSTNSKMRVKPIHGFQDNGNNAQEIPISIPRRAKSFSIKTKVASSVNSDAPSSYFRLIVDEEMSLSTSTRISIPGNKLPAISTSYTYAFWMYIPNYYPKYLSVFQWGANPKDNSKDKSTGTSLPTGIPSLFIEAKNQNIRFIYRIPTIFNGNDGVSLIHPALKLASWLHIAIIRNNNHFKIYINNDLVQSFLIPANADYAGGNQNPEGGASFATASTSFDQDGVASTLQPSQASPIIHNQNGLFHTPTEFIPLSSQFQLKMDKFILFNRPLDASQIYEVYKLGRSNHFAMKILLSNQQFYEENKWLANEEKWAVAEAPRDNIDHYLKERDYTAKRLVDRSFEYVSSSDLLNKQYNTQEGAPSAFAAADADGVTGSGLADSKGGWYAGRESRVGYMPRHWVIFDLQRDYTLSKLGLYAYGDISCYDTKEIAVQIPETTSDNEKLIAIADRSNNVRGQDSNSLYDAVDISWSTVTRLDHLVAEIKTRQEVELPQPTKSRMWRLAIYQTHACPNICPEGCSPIIREVEFYGK